MITMKVARSEFPRVVQADGDSFRTWARQAYKAAARSDLSPKLNKIVHGVPIPSSKRPRPVRTVPESKAADKLQVKVNRRR